MCGIIGYTGKSSALSPVIDGLRRLEYRGYDSAGIALPTQIGQPLFIEKRAGKLKNLEDALNKNTQSQNLGTDTQDKNTEVQEKTAKQLKQEERQARMQRMSSIGGPVAMAAGTAGMVAAMSGAPQTMTNFLFGISAVAGLLPLLANPLGMAVAGIAALGIAVYK